jgi:hypothetical protein
LEIRAFVRDQVSRGMATIRREITGTGQSAKFAAVRTSGLAKGLNDVGSRAATALVGFIGLNAGLRAYRTAIRAAVEEAKRMIAISSEVEESQSALAFVFEDSGEQQEAFIRKLSATTGRFSNDIRNFQVELAGIVKPLGFTAEETARIANVLSEVGVDLASFFNKSDADVFLKVIQGISGETEGMRRLGVDLRDAAVQAEAFRLGLGGPGGELSEAEKTIARLSLVVERSSDKLGDAQRTAESFANTMRRVTSTIKEVRAESGENLKRAILEAIEAGGGLDNMLAGITLALRFVAREAEGALIVLGKFAAMSDRVLGTEFGRALDLTRLEILARRLEALTGEEGIGSTIAGALLNVPPEKFAAAFTAIESELTTRISAAMADGAKDGLGAMRAEIGSLSPPDSGGGATDTTEALLAKWAATRSVFEGAVKLQSELDSTLAERISTLEIMRALERERLEIQLLQKMATFEDLQTMGHTLELFDKITEKQKEALRITEEETRTREEATRQMRENALAIGALQSGVDNFASAIGSIASGSQTAQEAFRNMASSIVGDIASMIARMAALRLAFAFADAAGYGAGFNQALGTSFVGSAKGNVFQGGELQKFAQGGVVMRPTVFPMARGGVGLMGEAGPEAVIPLRRGRGGRLGVEASGGAGASVNIGQGAIVVVAAPGQSPSSVAEAVMHQLLTNPQFISAVRGAGRA